MDVLFAANEGETIKWPPFMHRLIKRLLDAEFVETTGQIAPVIVSGMSISPNKIFITEKGRQFVRDIGLREL